MKLGIDIGGTFTDLVLLEPDSGKLFFGKTLTVVGVGFATVTATAPGNANYTAPTAVRYRIGKPY